MRTKKRPLRFRMTLLFEKIRRGPKLEGYAFANFGYSSGTEGESPCEVGLF